MFGNGVYANNSMFKATTAKGSDIVMLLVSVGLLITALKQNPGNKTRLLHGGFLISILYYSATTVFGLAYSKMFLFYVALFSTALFTFIISVIDLGNTIQSVVDDKKHTGTAIFTIAAGCTALVWLMSILPTLFTNAPLDIIEVSTTEPTFVIDIGLIFPTCMLGGILLLKNNRWGYVLPPIMLIFLTVIAVTVVGQTVVQLQYGVIISIQQVIGYVGTFVVFGCISAIVSTRFMLKCWPNAY